MEGWTTMSKKRALSWAPNWSKRGSGGRWRKQIDGKVQYFGDGKSEKDMKSYRAAEQKYFQFMQEREATKPISILVSEVTAADVCEKFLQNLYTRHERGEISAQHFDKNRICLNRFVAHVGRDTLFDEIGETDLEDFKDYVLSQPVSASSERPISRETAKGHLSIVKTMYKWSHKMRLIELLPRNLDDLTKISTNGNSEPKVLTFTLKELGILWKKGVPRHRCFLAMALNCGFGQQDISDLRMDEVDWKNGYIERDRSKTKVRAKHKLWAVTLELMKEHRHAGSSGNDRVFLTQIRQKEKNTGEAPKHKPLVRNVIRNGKLTKSDCIKNLFWRLRRKTGINDGRGFYCLRKTGASLIERIDPQATEMYLSHSEKGMKKNYAHRDWERLDNALGKMWEEVQSILVKDGK
jgi:integrase